MPKQVHKQGAGTKQYRPSVMVARYGNLVPPGRTGGKVIVKLYYRSGIPGSVIKPVGQREFSAATETEVLREADRFVSRFHHDAERERGTKIRLVKQGYKAEGKRK